MSKKRKAHKPEAPLAADPHAPVFQVGDEIVVQRRILWTGYRGTIESVEGGMCRCRIGFDRSERFTTDIPARELKLDL